MTLRSSGAFNSDDRVILRLWEEEKLNRSTRDVRNLDPYIHGVMCEVEMVSRLHANAITGRMFAADGVDLRMSVQLGVPYRWA